MNKEHLNDLNKEKNEIESCFIDKIKINNFYSIKHEIELSDLKSKKFIFLLGENGSGKTILLKSILICLKKYFINTKTSKDLTGFIDDILNEEVNKDFFLSATAYQDINKNTTDEFNILNQIYLKNLYAYGTNRHRISQTTKGEPYGFLTLFKDDQFLINIEEWIKDIERKELKKVQTITVNQVQTILKELLELDNLQIKIKDEKESKVIFEVNKIDFSLTQLSEGYRSVISFVIDLIARLAENNSTIFNIQDFKAIVLIDELDMFLHPTWEKNICVKLNKWFPEIQFFITTHSPILVDGIAKNNDLVDKMVLFKLKMQNNESKITDIYNGNDIKNWLPNILISSPLFDSQFLDSLDKNIILNARTENNFLEMKETDDNFEKLRENKIKLLYLENLKKVI